MNMTSKTTFPGNTAGSNYSLVALMALIPLLFTGALGRATPETTAGPAIQNPYAGVDWVSTGRHKAGLHTHTKASDGKMYPHDVIDRYHQLGYSILAITDHNKVTHPWTELATLYGEDFENRDPDAVGLLDIQGNEFSRHHHMGGYWTPHEGSKTEVESLEATLGMGGQTLLNHPGRYDKPVEWYADLFKRFPHLKGMEVYNQGDRYPGDRAKWDAVLTELMPARPVWGFSNDDMHTEKHLGRNWNILLLPELTDEEVRRGLDTGRLFFVYAPQGHDGPPPPAIHSLKVDQERARIDVEVSGHDRLEWISEGKVVHDGPTLDVRKVPGIGSYVRLMVYGAEGDTVVGTQAFGILSARE